MRALGRARRLRARAVLQAANAAGVQRPLPEAIRAWRAVHEERWGTWRFAYLLVLGGTGLMIIWDRMAVIAVIAVIAWVAAGAAAWIVESALRADLAGQRARHRAAPGPSIGGWRVRGDVRDLDPQAVIMADLIVSLYEGVRVVERPWRGHRGHRVSYSRPLRDECRRFAASRALPVRAGDRYGRQLLDLGVLCRVRICQVEAWRLTHRRCQDGLRALELALGVSLFDWELGRDPDA
jgi:hypothetical protein